MVTSPGTEIDGRYRLEEKVGKGGMATVWRASDLRLGRDVAIKVIAETRLDQPGFIARFEREAQLAARLSHPNLVSVHDVGVHEGRPYLVMEFIDGETLSRRLARAPETVDEIELARALLGVLVAIHEQGIVHRDIKPANVLYEDDGRIRLTDFGIARLIDSTSITQTNEVIGTLKYMAPEVRDATPPSPAADLYALGVLLAECGGTDGPLAPLVARLRNPDAAKRPASARLALTSIAGIETRDLQPEDETTPMRRDPTEVLKRPPGSPPLPPPTRATEPELESEPESTPASAPAAPPPTHGPAGRTIGFAAGFVAVLAAAAIAFALLSGGSDSPSAGTKQAAPGSASSQGDKGGGGGGSSQSADPAPAPATETTAEAGTPTEETVAETVDPAQGAALNQQGYDLLQAGNAEEAVPILQQAVASWPTDSTDINYAYALFNLGTALRQSGQPEEAIPYLEQRLNWNDQRATVKAELEAARAEAG